MGGVGGIRGGNGSLYCGTEASVSSWVKWGDRCLPGGHVAVIGETWQDYFRGPCMASTPASGLLWGNVEAGTLVGATEIMSTVMVAKA